MEQSRDRKEDLAELEDPRVDLCIFCIPPHRWGGMGAGWPMLLRVILSARQAALQDVRQQLEPVGSGLRAGRSASREEHAGLREKLRSVRDE